MNTITANNSAGTIDLPWQFKDGCSHKSDGETLKMRLRNGMGLSDDQFVKTVLEILHNNNGKEYQAWLCGFENFNLYRNEKDF